MPNKNKDSDLDVIAKMEAAYVVFSKEMAKLEKRADALVKKTLKQVDDKKIKQTLAKIKKLSK
jgi:hypothetical protein